MALSLVSLCSMDREIYLLPMKRAALKMGKSRTRKKFIWLFLTYVILCRACIADLSLTHNHSVLCTSLVLTEDYLVVHFGRATNIFVWDRKTWILKYVVCAHSHCCTDVIWTGTEIKL